MDKLGERLIRDRDLVAEKRSLADDFERKAKRLRSEADEIERLAELARLTSRHHDDLRWLRQHHD